MNAIVQYSPDQMALIKRTVAQGATDDELNLFIYDCQRRNIHPLDKLLHFTKRGGRYVPITSIDLMRSRAAETTYMAGSDDAVFVEGDGEHPERASVTVYRLDPCSGQRFAYTGTARWSEYHPGNAPMWKKMPYTMLAKCAEALALRKAFPQELAGLYAKEEMDQADAPVQRAAPKIGPNVINTIPVYQGEHTLPPGVIPQGYNPAPPSTPDAAVCDPQQEPATTVDTGKAHDGGLPNPMPPLATEAYKEASRGLQNYERWFLGLSNSERKQLLPYHETLKSAAAESDAI